VRRVALIVGLTALIATAGVLAAAGGTNGGYQVRAIFDTAAFIVPGEDVKVAGVKVGKVDSLHVTPENRAAVVLDIQDPGFQDFRTDARCAIRPQSLIGEQFVDCTPTQPRASTDRPAPPLPEIERGAGQGQRLLPVERTSTSVALDLVGNINRLPVRQRLSLIINELGVGLAGRGDDLNEVLRRSAPALQELDQVLGLLADQNRTLARLARDSDTDLAPLARERRHVTGFIAATQRAAAATAERRQQLAASLRRLPGFLAQLRPTMRRLGQLAGQGTPVFSDLRSSAADINEVIERMGPFSAAATPALVRLGEVGGPGIPALRASLPIVKDLRGFAAATRPVAKTLADVLDSFRRNDGVPNAMDFIYYSALAVNGFDSVSHFLRAGLIVNTCSTYTVTPQDECLSKFATVAGASSASAPAGTDEVLRRTAAVLRGADPEDLAPAAPARAVKPKAPAKAGAKRQATATPDATPGPAAPAATPGPAGTEVLDYLLGSDGA
jgi:ABC-type transporter Mla subunit MlaD